MKTQKELAIEKFGDSEYTRRKISEKDLERAWVHIVDWIDPELKYCCDWNYKNREYTFYKGDFKGPDYQVGFKNNGEAYWFLLNTYGSAHPTKELSPV
jgi:hypothetical protein